MDYETLSAMGVRLEWVADRLRLADIKPRHIGRVVTFTTVNDHAYQGTDVIGTLEGAVGSDIIVSGDNYDYAEIQDLRVWRRAVKND